MKLQRAIEVIKGGGFLMAEQDADGGGVRYRCIPGGTVTNSQAAKLISELSLKPGDDSLIPGEHPQTWRL